VIRGNLLVIPVEQTVMYVQPVYLQATASAGAPTELQFVIVVTNLQVEMRPTLEEALQAIADADAGVPADEGTANVEDGTGAGTAVARASVADALIAFERGEAALREGDWVGYGEAQVELRRILEDLARASGIAPVAEGAVEPESELESGATPVP
jgi:uncharacterized membrane protein (UPF0182 family)